ncbi:MAG: DUF58 domain-containing protein [Planctomycetota bacterium]|nr:MAG: DUF58 domain-containing protein [Planctomycetota bacterium]
MDQNGTLFDSEFMRKLEYLNLIARKVLSGLFRAERQSHKKGVSLEFSDYRPYAPGDDFRYVDWHIYGRLDEFFLKLFREEENLCMYIFLDCSTSMDFGKVHKFIYALKIAAALSFIGMSNMDSVSVFPFSEALMDDISGLRGRGKVFDLFRFLEVLKPQGLTNMQQSLRAFTHRSRRRGIAFVITDLFDIDGYSKAIKMLRFHKHEIYLIHVSDTTEREPTLHGDLKLVDSESEAERTVTITSAIRKRYRRAFGDFREEVENFCKKNEFGYVHADTQIPFDELILKVLRRGGVLA